MLTAAASARDKALLPVLLPFGFWLMPRSIPASLPGAPMGASAATTAVPSPSASPVAQVPHGSREPALLPSPPLAADRPLAVPAPCPDPAVLIAAIAAHLAALGWPAAEPLRWAITAVDPRRGWQLEGIAMFAAAPPKPPR
ncbi:MAG: hypothetical protein ACKO0M_08935 [Cyanobium sp.]